MTLYARVRQMVWNWFQWLLLYKETRESAVLGVISAFPEFIFLFSCYLSVCGQLDWHIWLKICAFCSLDNKARHTIHKARLCMNDAWMNVYGYVIQFVFVCMNVSGYIKQLHYIFWEPGTVAMTYDLMQNNIVFTNLS